MAFSNFRIRAHLCHTEKAGLQLLLLLQILHNGVWETSRLVLWKRSHGRRELKPRIQNFLCLWFVGSSSNSFSLRFLNARVGRNKNCRVGASSRPSAFQRHRKKTQVTKARRSGILSRNKTAQSKIVISY